MASSPRSFLKSDKIVSHTIGKYNSLQGANQGRVIKSATRPAPLIQNTGCASCRKRARGG